MTTQDIAQTDTDRRIVFHTDDQIMEASFEDIRFETSAEVNAFYDRLEERIAATGETLWFFLVNYKNTYIDSSAWFAFSRRGRDLNMAHSMGSVRFDASEITRRQIEQAGGRENFDPNLFYDRDEAIAHLRDLPSRRDVSPEPALRDRKGRFPREELNWRIEFDPDLDIMNVDFTGMSFENSTDVNDVYDFIEEQIAATGKKWYFLINYEGTRIQSPAWVQYAARGKTLNETWSLGSVRYAPGSETETDIRLRAESQGFRPNIRNTRDEAIERIAEMKAEGAAQD